MVTLHAPHLCAASSRNRHSRSVVQAPSGPEACAPWNGCSSCTTPASGYGHLKNPPLPQNLRSPWWSKCIPACSPAPSKKANPLARAEYLKLKRQQDTLYNALTRPILAKAEGSEDAFDALVCCIEMVRWQAEFSRLCATLNPNHTTRRRNLAARRYLAAGGVKSICSLPRAE